MIKLDNIRFHYPNSERNILEGCCGEFHRGTFYSIMGPSGAGKSTLLSIMAGIEKPIGGTLSIDGNTVDENAIRIHNIAFIFQNFLLFPYMTAIENIVTAMDIRCPDEEDKEGHARSILHSLSIRDADMNRKVKKLSGGEQQRVAIARALAMRSDYIFADEPTGNLDRKTAEGLIELLAQISHESKIGLIVVTHSEMVRDAADQAFILRDGQLIHQGEDV